MNVEISVITEQYERRLRDRLNLLNLRLAYLCVDAEPLSLIPVKVQDGGVERNIEDVAYVSKESWNRFLIAAQTDCDLNAIAAAIAAEQPDFKQERLELPVTEGSDDKVEVLLVTVPPVDDARKAVLNTAADALHKEFEAMLAFEKTAIAAKLVRPLLTASSEDKDNLDKVMGELGDEIKDQGNKVVEDKKKAIEEAYQKYLETQAERDKLKAAADTALNPDAAFGMKMGQ